MIEGLFDPAHILSIIFLLLLWGAPIWFAFYVATSLKQIKESLKKITESLQNRT